MYQEDLDKHIIDCGKRFFKSIKDGKPSLFNKDQWVGKALDWAMNNEAFKINLFRFVDVFPYLNSGKSLTRHIKEYFGEDEDMPAVLKWGAKGAGLTGAIGSKILNTAISFNIKSMAKQFIIGENTKNAIKNIEKLRQNGFAFVLDLLGEATISEEESEYHFRTYLELLHALGAEQVKWTPLPQKWTPVNIAGKDWSYYPYSQIAVKLSALYSQIKPADFDNSVQNILKRLESIYEKVISIGASLFLDMESFIYKDITLEVFRRLRSNPKYREYPHLGIVLQAYLRCTDEDLDGLITWSKAEDLPIEIRLVKGAYWDYETVIAEQNNWEPPCVYTEKAETDAAFERLSRKILENHESCYFACGSHNIRSICATIEMAKQLNVPEDRYEFQVLSGMAEPVRNTLRDFTGRVRLYCPYGEMIPGMAYLVRRLLENTSNESFLRQSFVEEEEVETLLQNPLLTLKQKRATAAPIKFETDLFKNEPHVDFTIKGEAQCFIDATARVRKQIGKTYPLFINGKEIFTKHTIKSLNPNIPDEVVGIISYASKSEAEQAIKVAKEAFPSWRDTSPEKRAQYLIDAAAVARKRFYELSAWQILEVGKQWDQAHSDVTEAIDFLEYYAKEMIRLGKPLRLGHFPGEVNLQSYEPRGVAVIIAPWNFPLAISLGMVSAAIVTGNAVVYKPSGLSAIIGYNIVQLFQEVGLPKGVFNYVPGPGSEIGDFMVEHPDTLAKGSIFRAFLTFFLN